MLSPGSARAAGTAAQAARPGAPVSSSAHMGSISAFRSSPAISLASAAMVALVVHCAGRGGGARSARVQRRLSRVPGFPPHMPPYPCSELKAGAHTWLSG